MTKNKSLEAFNLNLIKISAHSCIFTHVSKNISRGIKKIYFTGHQITTSKISIQYIYFLLLNLICLSLRILAFIYTI